MSGILGAIRDFSLLTVVAAVFIYILLRGELAFRYPRRHDEDK